MKKYLIATLSALALAGCSQNFKKAETNPMLGDWICVTNYYDYEGVGVRTEDFIQFEKDGFYSSNGMILLPVTGKPFFAYNQETLGKWEYKNNELTMYTANVVTVPEHSTETMKKLKKDKKLREIEKILANGFEKNTAPVTFKIITQKEDVIMLEQEIGGKRYFPRCMKAEAFEQKVKSGEIKLTPND